jgi:hypothetical protein
VETPREVRAENPTATQVMTLVGTPLRHRPCLLRMSWAFMSTLASPSLAR